MSGDEKEQQLQRELAECVMSSSWIWCVVGLGIAIPIGVKTKSYNPVVYLGLGGTLLDLLHGYNRCQAQRDALASYQEAFKAFGPAATTTSLSSSSSSSSAGTALEPTAPAAGGTDIGALIAAAEAERAARRGGGGQGGGA